MIVSETLRSMRTDSDLQMYAWVAVYKDGTFYTEYAEDGGNNSFYQIDRDNLSYYALVGKDGNVFGFGVSSGIFYINDKSLKVLFYRV